MEQTFVRKSAFAKFAKLTFIGIILLVVLILVGLYFIGVYDTAEIKYNHKYDDEFWNQETLDGFKYYPELTGNVEQYNYTSNDYKYPWVLDGVMGNTLSDEQKIDYGRYKEEVDKIAAPYVADLKTAQSEFNNFANGQWDSSKTVEEWIETKLELELDEYKDVVIEQATAFEYATAKGYTGTKTEFEQLVKTVSSFSSLNRTLGRNGYEGNDEELCAAIRKDTALYAFICQFDQDGYDKAEAKVNTLQALVDRANNLKATLSDWNTYLKNEVLGFGGLAYFEGKPALTYTRSDGSKYEFYFSIYYTSFKLVLKDASDNVIQEWVSNPVENDTTATQAVQTIEQSTLTVSYAILKGQTGKYSTYEYSVSTKNLQNNSPVNPNFAIKWDKESNKFLVWYKLEKRGIDYTYFPKYFSEDHLKELLARNKELYEAGAVTESGEAIPDLSSDAMKKDLAYFTQSIYKKVDKDMASSEFPGINYYEYSGSLAFMSYIEINRAYKFLYDYCGYTDEDLEQDNMEFNQETTKSDPSFSLAIEYELTENGLVATVPGNSIKEDPRYPITFIEILPYFSATQKGVEGYTIIPDGSGAVMEHDNGNINYSRYEKRVYTKDLTTLGKVGSGSSEDLMFPMYGVVNTGNNSGLLVYASKAGGELKLTCDISGRQDNYNTNYFTAYLRESKTITVGTASYERKSLIKWTNAKSTEDIVINYETLNQDELSYSGVAKKYRNVLIDLYDITLKDNTDTPTLNMDVLGVYSYQEHMIGIPYTAKDTLTTIDQFNAIVDAMKGTGVEYINAVYKGWRNSGLSNTTFTNMKSSTLIGSRAKFKALLENNSNNVEVYPYVSFGQVNKFKESFGKNHYTAKAVDGNLAKNRPYDLNSNIYDKTKPWNYVISPRYYFAFAEQLADNYNKQVGSSNIAIDYLGSKLSGDYKKNKEMFKVGAVKEQIKSLEEITNSGINNLSLYTPYDYAFKYTTVGLEIPYQDTKYEILDYAIPFYQLVVNGMFDYSGESVNAESEKGNMEHIMRMIETGSNIAFTFTGDSSEKLLQTDYNTYYYTLYTDWIEDVKQIYNELNSLGIYKLELTSHEKLINNVYKVTYGTGADEVVIYLNYTRNAYTAADGTVVGAKSYEVRQ